MNAETTKTVAEGLELPASAPRVRVTAGAGSAGQKTWNIRRPVTLIGARRPAHIVLHDKNISKAHCVLINTGTDVILRDLGSASGTFCNKKKINATILSDGDVISVGSTTIQVAIQIPENENDDSAVGEAYADPTKFSTPITLRLASSTIEWTIEDSTAVIGRHEAATIRLEHQDVSTRHALLFSFENSLAIFDLGGRTGVGVNGLPCRISRLCNGDRISIGPCTLEVASEMPTMERPVTPDNSRVDPEDFDKTPPGTTGGVRGLPETESIYVQGSRIDFDGQQAVAGDFAEIDKELSNLHTDIAASWSRLNNWEARLRNNAERLDTREQDLQERTTGIESKDAAMRGQLHDLTRYTEQISIRERELASILSKVKTEQAALISEKAEGLKREDELARRSTELKRREHVLAQRWARLLAANCPHCGKAVRTRQATSPNPPIHLHPRPAGPVEPRSD